MNDIDPDNSFRNILHGMDAHLAEISETLKNAFPIQEDSDPEAIPETSPAIDPVILHQSDVARLESYIYSILSSSPDINSRASGSAIQALSQKILDDVLVHFPHPIVCNAVGYPARSLTLRVSYQKTGAEKLREELGGSEESEKQMRATNLARRAGRRTFYRSAEGGDYGSAIEDSITDTLRVYRENV